MKKILCLLFAMLLLLSLASTTLAAPATEPAALILERSVKAFNAAKSYEVKMSAQLLMKARGESMDMSILTDTRYFTSPLKMHCKTDLKLVSSLPANSLQMQMYMLRDGKKPTTYIHDDEGWSKTSGRVRLLGNIDPFDNYNFAAYAQMCRYLEVEMDTYNGKPVYKLTAWLDPLAAMDLAADLEEADIDLSDIADILDAQEQYTINVPISMLIDAETYLPQYMAFDMVKPLRRLLDMDDVSPQMASIDKYLLKITYLNYNHARKIVVPAAARRAKTR